MALRPLTDLTPCIFDDGSSFSLNSIFWYPGVGLFGITGSLGGFFIKITLDGVTELLSHPIGFGPNWNPISNAYYCTNGNLLYKLEPLSLIGLLVDSQPTFTISDPGFSGVYNGQFIGYGGTKISPGRYIGEVFLSAISSLDSVGCFFDLKTQSRVSSLYHLGEQADSFVYSPDFNIFIQQAGSNIRLWSMETAPSTISPPILILGEEKSGSLATYQVTVKGSQGEPSVGEIINWTNTGVGLLIDDQSVTDDLGNATARILFSFSDIGEVVLTATLID